MIRRVGFAAAVVAATAITVGCAGSPVPTQRLADAESSMTTAQAQGADADPQAKLHLKLAQEEIAKAKQLMESNDNDRARDVLLRAKADADLALVETREVHASMEAKKAQDEVDRLRATVGPVNGPASTTTITSANGGTQ